MDTYLIIALILIILTIALVLMGSETMGIKIYKAICAAAMAVIGVLGFKFLIEGTSTSTSAI